MLADSFPTPFLSFVGFFHFFNISGSTFNNVLLIILTMPFLKLMVSLNEYTQSSQGVKTTRAGVPPPWLDPTHHASPAFPPLPGGNLNRPGLSLLAEVLEPGSDGRSQSSRGAAGPLLLRCAGPFTLQEVLQQVL